MNNAGVRRPVILIVEDDFLIRMNAAKLLIHLAVEGSLLDAYSQLNSKNGENLVFSEKFTKVTKGDTVTFKATKPGTTLSSFREPGSMDG